MLSTNLLSPDDLTALIALRHALHQHPEISGEECETAKVVSRELTAMGCNTQITQLGGHGVAAIFESPKSGPTVMIRCELDALPIADLSGLPYASTRRGQGHLCGHDGHMVIALGLAKILTQHPPERGRVVILFQPAEETGAGARAVLSDPRFAEIMPEYAYALHNYPGRPLGQVALVEGPANCASRGVKVTLTGKSSHASDPQDGISPAPAIARLITDLPQLSQGQIDGDDFRLVTVTHVDMGTASYGIAPGEATLLATLRSVSDSEMVDLVQAAETVVKTAAKVGNLKVKIDYEDIFSGCVNGPAEIARLKTACGKVGIPTDTLSYPMRWSEDFGEFHRAGAQSAMFFLGSGENHPQLHNPDYDFPDRLISPAIHVFFEVLKGHWQE
ncbi:MAG: amidohydrolase [Halocynthiibacter sp.]